MKAETAVRAELKAIGSGAVSSALGVVALGLACRLDGDVTARDAASLARELRMILRDVAVRFRAEGVGEVEEFLKRIADG